MLNVPRFQLALNSDDPDIVKLGLQQFLQQLLQEHQDVEESFGNDAIVKTLSGDFQSTLYPKPPTKIEGLLRLYLDASPQIEEFFVLWDLPNRLLDHELVGLHMQCLSALLFCCSEQVQFCRYVVNRIMNLYQESLIKQLEINDAFVSQMTLSVILTCYRIQKTMPDELFSCILSGLSSKSIIFHVDQYSSLIGLVETRPVLAVLLYLLIDNQLEPSYAIKIFKDEKGLKNLFRDLTKSSNRSIQILLQGMLYLVTSNRLVKDYISKFVSRMILGKIADLSVSKDATKSDLADLFLLEMSKELAKLLVDKESQSKTAIKHASNCTNDLLDSLKPVLNDSHSQVQLILIRANPSYLKKCIHSLKLSSWEPQPSTEYLDTLDHLIFLIRESPLDTNIAVRSLHIMDTPSSTSLISLRALCSSVVQALLPQGLTNKEIAQLILHDNNSLRMAGIKLINQTLVRLVTLFDDVLQTHRSIAEVTIVECICEVFPDFAHLYNSRTSFFSALAQLLHPNATKEPATEVDDIDMDIQLNLGDNDNNFQINHQAETSKDTQEMVHALSQQQEDLVVATLSTYFQSLSTWCRIAPVTIARSKCDVLRFVEEFLSILSGSINDSSVSVKSAMTTVLIDLLAFIDFFDERGLCSWFGTEEESGKLLNAVIVNEDWRSATKKSTLYKLFHLISISNDPVIKRKGSDFVMQLLLRSGLFGAKPYDSIELVHEAGGWIRVSEDSDSMLLMEITLRLAFHFAPSIGVFIQKLGLSSVDSCCSSVMQVVIMFCSGNMVAFNDLLPKFIQSYVHGLQNTSGVAAEGQKSYDQSLAFFEKFNRGFRYELEKLAISVFTQSLSSSRNYFTFCNLYAQLSQLQSFFPSSKILAVISELSAAGVDFKEKSLNITSETQWNGDFLSSMEYSLQNFKQILCHKDTSKNNSSKGKPNNKKDKYIPISEELISFIDKYWKILALRALSCSKLSYIPNEFFSWIEIQCKFENLDEGHSWEQSALLMFVLNCLSLINDHLMKRVKSESDLEKTKCANCLALADFLGEITMKLVNNVIGHEETVLQVVSCSLLERSIGSDNAFGMLSRNIMSIIVESVSKKEHHSKGRFMLNQKIHSMVMLMISKKVQIKSAMLDPSFFRFLSAVSKVVEEDTMDVSGESSSNCYSKQLLHIYSNLKIVMTSVLSEGFKGFNITPGQYIIPCDDPVYRIGEFSPLDEFDTLFSNIVNKSSINKNAKKLSPFLLPIVKECKDGFWTFFDFYTIATNKNENLHSVRLDNRLQCLDDFGKNVMLSSCLMFIGSGPFNQSLLEERCHLLESNLKAIDAMQIAVIVENLMDNFESEELCAVTMRSLIRLLKTDLSLVAHRMMLYLVYEDLLRGGRHLIDGSLVTLIVNMLLKDSSGPLEDEFLTNVMDLCVAQCKESFGSTLQSKQFYIAQIIDFAISVGHAPNAKQCQNVWISLEKWVKLCLWAHIGDQEVISAIQNWILATYATDDKTYVSLPSMESSLNPLKMLRLIISHQSIGETISASHDSDLDGRSPATNDDSVFFESHHKKDHKYPVLLRLILCIVKILGNFSFEEKPLNATLQKLHKQLLPHYKGTFAESDRIIHRILSIVFDRYKVGSPMYQLKPVFVLSTSHSANSWVCQFIKPPTVYNTLANFPLWRSLSPQPFEWEPLSLQERSSFSHKQLQFKGKFCGNLRHANEYHVEYPLAAIDFNLGSSSMQYDPAYLVPIILATLKKYDVSIRQLTNCGGLSLVIAALSSECSMMRTYSLACLALIWKFANEQDAEKDPSFRERPQILQLLSFLRNSIERSSDTKDRGRWQDKSTPVSTRKSIPQIDSDGSVFRLPLTTSVFLAKAALHMMQPKHELYIPTNLYLIGRPICDIRDIPLFDLLVHNADSETEQSERLSALRSIRDGLRTREDHLNLCRKNGYSKLMLLFPIFANDHRAGHALFDIFDNAFRYPESTRYLVEKCNFSVWLQNFAFSAGASKRVSILAESVTNAAFSTHSVNLLRRILSSVYLLNCQNVTSGLSDCFITINNFVNAAISCIDLVALDSEYLSSLLLLCEEAIVCQRALVVAGEETLFSILDWTILQDLAFTLYESLCCKKDCYEYFGTIAVLISHTGNFVSISNKWAHLIKSFVQDMTRLFIHGVSMSSCKEKVQTHLLYSCLHAPMETFLTVKNMNLSQLGVVALLDTVVKDDHVLPTGLPYSDRVDLVWNLLAHHSFTSSDPLPDKLGIGYISLLFVGLLRKLQVCNAAAQIREQSMVWCLVAWNTCFSSIVNHCSTQHYSQYFTVGNFKCSMTTAMKLFVTCPSLDGLSDHLTLSLHMLKSLAEVSSWYALLEAPWATKFSSWSSTVNSLMKCVATKDNWATFVSACEANLRCVQIVASLESKFHHTSVEIVPGLIESAVYFFESIVKKLEVSPLSDKKVSPAQFLLELFQQQRTLPSKEVAKVEEKVEEKQLQGGKDGASGKKKRAREIDNARDAEDPALTATNASEQIVRLRKIRRWQPLSRAALLLYTK